MKFGGGIQRRKICGILTHSRSLESSRPLNRLWNIHSHGNTVNFKVQSGITGFEWEIIE